MGKAESKHVPETPGKVWGAAWVSPELPGPACPSSQLPTSSPLALQAAYGLDARAGLSLENVIRENQWGGVDIRRGGVPVLRSNLICFGYSDGVVVGDEGRGLIEGNTIYGEEPLLGEGPGARPCLGGRKPGPSFVGRRKLSPFFSWASLH